MRRTNSTHLVACLLAERDLSALTRPLFSRNAGVIFAAYDEFSSDIKLHGRF
jgi:hypothetical protein